MDWGGGGRAVGGSMGGGPLDLTNTKSQKRDVDTKPSSSHVQVH